MLNRSFGIINISKAAWSQRLVNTRLSVPEKSPDVRYVMKHSFDYRMRRADWYANKYTD
jgi:hypothetical protein